MTNLHQSKIYSSIIKYNRRLTKTYTWSDNVQRIYATGFNNQLLWCPKRISICAILATTDDKYVACMRKSSFLFTEIIRSRNDFRKRRLFTKYSNFLKKRERKYLSTKLNIDCEELNISEEHNDIIFPGGLPKSGEDAISCLSRELKEEINIDCKDISIDSRFFVHLLIEDLLTDRVFDSILFLGKVMLSSEQILKQFSSNREIKSLVFLDKVGNSVANEIVNYAVTLSKFKCTGSSGCKTDALYKYSKHNIKELNICQNVH
ncbi:mRNA decapping enzyme [Eptesipox virus]|uniref:mRNA decapping enzyme n=1 Tax=Eptesipox virus TaxID=1329402 RepID=A0A220T6F6_9POXV|nr:mRNA decapping enzyme [Eptesipox virus]ASK51293.1 mRNA decapping enzyme [Eptesipox virus]WAH71051.1 mRNA decapping enzyme [Eptesipox virus]